LIERGKLQELMMKIAMAAAALALVGVLIGLGQPETKPKMIGPMMIEPKGLNALTFLRGAWSGKMGEDVVEETWSGAQGDSIIGMFRWQAGGKQTTMWELLSIKEEEGKPVLRLRHFDAKFEPWKNELGPVDAMPATEVSTKRVLFVAPPDGKGGLKSVEYKSPKADVLEITVSFKDADRAALEFDLKRQ